MAEQKTQTISINRAPVLTLWGTVVTQRLGHDKAAALTLGKTLASLNAQSKGRRLGIFDDDSDAKGKKKATKKPAPANSVELLGRRIPVKRTKSGLRAVSKGAAVDAECGALLGAKVRRRTGRGRRCYASAGQGLPAQAT